MIKFCFHHVGIGTTEFDAGIEVYLGLGYRKTLQVDDACLGVRVALLEESDSPIIEIVAPLDENSPLRSFIKRKQLPSPYHTCYEVSDIEAGRNFLIRERGFLAVGELVPALAFSGRRIGYHYHWATGLLEIVEAL